MPKQVIIDCDPGIDDAVALCLALFDPRVEVLAITAVEGNALADQVSRNVQAIIEQLDPPLYPRFGSAQPCDYPPTHNLYEFHGTDGLGDCGFEVSLLQHQHPSEKVIVDIVRANPGNVSILALGPLTNISRALQRDPEIATMIREVVMIGGCVNAIGNVTACAEFNMFYDPVSANAVFDSPMTKTLVPLDVTRNIPFSFELMDQLPGDETRAGDFLRRIIPFSFRAHRQRLGMESICLHDVIAFEALLNPELFQGKELHGRVETDGTLTRGMTVFDRRDFPEGRPNMEVLLTADVTEVTAAIVRGLKYAGQCSVKSD